MSMSAPAPVEKKFLPVSAPWFGPEEKHELLSVLDSDWITTGPRTKQFEQLFSEYTRAAESIALSSCTGALHLALQSLEIGADDAVITTPFTFSATANTVV